MNIQDRRKTLTVEELRRRYNLDSLDKDRKAIKLQKEQLTKVDAELNDFVEITTKNLKELQDQVDGNITTWFFNGVPTMETEPASNWTTDTDKNNHLGDLYYDQDTGYAYRWTYENNVYTWSKIVDADVVEALAVANAAQDTADSKRRVFVVQPIPPYDIGDIWIKEDTDLYRCRASRSEDNFNIADWIRATNYTDDTVALGTKAELDQFKTQVTENYVSNATLETTVNSITGKVEETYTYVTTIENQVNDITTTTQTSTGKNNLHITDSLESNALEYHIEGNSEQETYGDINLFDEVNFVKGAYAEFYAYDKINGITLKTRDDTPWANISYLINVVGGTTYYCKVSNFSSLSKISFVHYDSNNQIISFTNLTENGSFTVPTNCTYLKVKISADTYPAVAGNIILSTTDVEYQPYSSPSPDYPSEIKTIPSIRNLFDKDNANILDKIYVDFGNGIISSTPNVNKTLYIPINGGKTYTVSKIKSARFTLGTTEDVPSDGVALINKIQNNSASSITLETSENANYLSLHYFHSSDTLTEQEILDSIMIEEGSIVHDYVPYGAWAKVKITGKNIFDFKNWNPLINNGTSVIDTGELSLTLTATNNDCYTYGSNIFKIKEQTNYTFRVETDATTQIAFWTVFYDKDRNRIGSSISQQTNEFGGILEKTFTSPANTKYVTIRVDNDISGAVVKYTNFYLAEEDSFSEYEEYKEKEVLIDLSKPNLFDKNKIEIGNSWNNNKVSTRATLVIEYEPNKRYSIKCSKMEGFEYVSIIETPDRLNAGYAVNQTEPFELTRTLNSNAKYLCIQLQTTSDFDVSILDNLELKIYEDSETDYYELSSIGDTKDTLDIVNGQVVIDKKIDKIVLDGSEKWSTLNYSFFLPTLNKTNNSLCTHFENSGSSWASSDVNYRGKYSTGNDTNYWKFMHTDETITTSGEFKTWLSENNVTVYYELAESKQISLPNVNIPLFEGINHISLVDDLETTTSIKYYRNTPIAQDYVVQQQLDETNSNLSTTTDKTNQNASDINATNTNLNNNYYSKDQIDVMNTSTEQIITQIRNQVETTTNATNLQISILQEQLTNGVTAVRTETGYTFDKDGLKIQKSGSEMSSQLDNDGLVVKRNSTEVLTVRSSGVETENLIVRTHFIIGDNTRVENYKNGTGFFYIGGAN